jgi:hypothetical protein
VINKGGIFTIRSFLKISFISRRFKICTILKGLSNEINEGLGNGGMCLEAKSSSTTIPILLLDMILKLKNK